MTAVLEGDRRTPSQATSDESTGVFRCSPEYHALNSVVALVDQYGAGTISGIQGEVLLREIDKTIESLDIDTKRASEGPNLPYAENGWRRRERLLPTRGEEEVLLVQTSRGPLEAVKSTSVFLTHEIAGPREDPVDDIRMSLQLGGRVRVVRLQRSRVRDSCEVTVTTARTAGDVSGRLTRRLTINGNGR